MDMRRTLSGIERGLRQLQELPRVPPPEELEVTRRVEALSDDGLEIWLRIVDLVRKNSPVEVWGNDDHETVPETYWRGQWWYKSDPLHDFLRGGPYVLIKAEDTDASLGLVTPHLSGSQIGLLAALLEEYCIGAERMSEENMITRIRSIVL